MLPTFVIGLREGLEAALIVSIIAAFLRKQGRLDLLRWVYIGVGTAVLLCVGVGVALEILSHDLPQKQQEGLETVVGTLAVAMVTYMVVWMKQHSRDLKGTLEGAAASALEGGSEQAGRALVVMAFLAVLREGFETVVFLIAAFNETGNGASPIAGAVFGIVVAVTLGWGIYRGGVRLNLSKFFRATGLVLVLIAAGLVVTALHTAHEAGWLNSGQGSTVSLSWLVRPDTVRSSLLTGMLGVQPHPVVLEVVGWLVYLVPVGVFVAWPPGRRVAPRRVAALAGAGGLAAVTAAVVLAVLAPASPARHPITGTQAQAVQVVTSSGTRIVVRSVAGERSTTYTLDRAGSTLRNGLAVGIYTGSLADPDAAAGRPATLSATAIARLNGGRLPLGLTAGAQAKVPVTYSGTTRLALEATPDTMRVLSATWNHQVTAVVHATVGALPLDQAVVSTRTSLPTDVATAAGAAATRDHHQLSQRRHDHDLTVVLAAVAVVLLALAGGAAVRDRLRPKGAAEAPTGAMAGHKVSLT